jgi:hypothetical protein
MNHEMFAVSLNTVSAVRDYGIGEGSNLRTVRSRIMTNTIQIELPPDNIVKIQFGSEDIFGFPGRPCEHLSERADNHTSTIDHDIVRMSIVHIHNSMVRRVILFGGKLTCGQDKASPLESDMNHRVCPHWTMIHSWSAVDLGTKGIIVCSH